MKLRFKLILAIIITAIVSGLSLFLGSNILLTKNFTHIETGEMYQNIQRLDQAIDSYLMSLETTVTDWSQWDETYHFAQEPNQQYIEDNLGDSTFAYLKVNIIAVVDLHGEIIAAKGWDIDNAREVMISPDLQSALSSGYVSQHNSTDSSHIGILRLPEGPFLYASKPILTSEGEGPILGAMIMGRYLDSQVIQELSERIVLPVFISPIDSEDAPAASQLLTPNNPRLVKPLNRNTIAGYLLLNDAAGQPYLVAGIEIPREIYLQGMETVTRIGWVIAAFTLLFIILGILAVDRVLLSRLHRLEVGIVAISNEGDFSMRVPVEGNDELALVANQMNTTLVKLSESQEMLHMLSKHQETILAAIPDIIMEVDKNKVYTWANQAGLEFFGEDVIGKEALYYFEGEQDIFNSVQTIFDGKEETVYVENWQRRKDGEKRLLAWWCRSLTDSDGNTVGALSAAQDITERKQAEQDLRESKALVDAVVENVPLMIFLKEAKDLRFVIFNRAGEELLGYDRKLLLGKNDLDIFPPEQAAHFMAKDREVLDGKANMIDIAEEPIQTAKKGQRFLHTRKVAIRGADGVTKYLLGISEDITERKQMEVEKQELRDKAEVSNRLAAVGGMAAGIAHEIYNPLTGILGFSRLLSERQDLPEDVLEELRIISDGSIRVKDIVGRMLTFARQTKPMKIPAGINELIEATLGLRAYVLRTANIEVIKHFDRDLPWIVIDPGQMQQVFLNIIINAEYAMKKAHDKGLLVITTEKKDEHILISFRDDGPGVSREIKDKLFNPFFTTKDVGEGTGLGLSLSRSIILEHKGTIEVESQPGKGSNFIITLPITPLAEEAPAEVVTTVSEKKVRAARILVVDDEDSIRKLISTMLIVSGHTVDAVKDSEEVLARIEDTVYDAVVMDIRMPGMGGMELYENITAKHPELLGKLIFITGDTADHITRDFLEQNKLTYINKPFDREVLLNKVNAIL